MSDDEDWSPNGGNSTDVADQSSDTFDMELKSKPNTKQRRTSSNSNKKNDRNMPLADDEKQQADDTTTTTTTTSSTPTSDRSVRARRRSGRSSTGSTSSTKSKNAKMEIDSDDDDDDVVVMSSKSGKSKKSKKRKADETDLEQPQPISKKAKTSENSNSNSKPKTKKKPAKKSTDAVDRVREFMLDANRPFAASALRTEIKPEIGLAQLKKSLQTLAEDGVLSMKEFGRKTKTQIYWRNQELDENNGDGENAAQESVSEIEARTAASQADLEQKRRALKELKSATKTLEAEPTDVRLKQLALEAGPKYIALRDQVAALNADDAPTCTQADLDAKLVEFYKFGKVWKERREKTYDVIAAMFEESREKPKHILQNRFKGETDADADANFDDLKATYKLAQMAHVQQNSKRVTGKKKK